MSEAPTSEAINSAIETQQRLERMLGHLCIRHYLFGVGYQALARELIPESAKTALEQNVINAFDDVRRFLVDEIHQEIGNILPMIPVLVRYSDVTIFEHILRARLQLPVTWRGVTFTFLTVCVFVSRSFETNRELVRHDRHMGREFIHSVMLVFEWFLADNISALMLHNDSWQGFIDYSKMVVTQKTTLLGKFSIRFYLVSRGFSIDFDFLQDEKIELIKKVYHALGKIIHNLDSNCRKAMTEELIPGIPKILAITAGETFVEHILKARLPPPGAMSWRAVAFCFMSAGHFIVHCFKIS